MSEAEAVQRPQARVSLAPSSLEKAVLDHLHYDRGKDARSATLQDIYHCVARAVRDRLTDRWMRTNRTYYEKDVKRVYYLSAEFLLGRALSQNMQALGIHDLASRLLKERGVELSDVLEEERDPGLGNGGLGRLAACFLDSMATLGIAGYGYGIRYEYGIFEQLFQDGRQVERGDDWLDQGNPWEIPRPEYAVHVNFYGRVEGYTDAKGRYRVQWNDTKKVLGVPYDTPVAGYDNNTVNTLRLWSARAAEEFDLEFFNAGDYRRAVENKVTTETISKVLYPSDESPEGKELRLKQQYFFCACAIADIMRRYKKTHKTFDEFPNKVAIQLNDTHPAITVAELMRVLVDVEGLEWDEAWGITQRTVAYTNHTLMPEALEQWPLQMFERMLPRHLQIIFEINKRFLREVSIKWPNDHDRSRRMSLIGEGSEKTIRMAHLAVAGSHSVNGVAALHSELVKSDLLPDFYALWPERFNNKTNGVTPRRWIFGANPDLTQLISEKIGNKWMHDQDYLKDLVPYAEEAAFRNDLAKVKKHNKAQLAAIIKEKLDLEVDLSSVFDVQVKRIHEYKRQLLNCLHIVSLYLDIKRNPDAEFTPRTFIFGGKAAAGYYTAKQHIKLINDVATVVNRDPAVRGRLKVAFLPNYSVSLAERIIPAADLSEQISLAGKEASGTGNMKFAMNGALTVGTLDGANVEIRECVGEENFFLFGMTTPEVMALRKQGYDPAAFIAKSPKLQEVLELIESGFFSPDDIGRFHDITHNLRTVDYYMTCADFDDYCRAQGEVSEAYKSQDSWLKMAALNIARVGTFSSDRTIRQYADEIWGAKPVKIEL